MADGSKYVGEFFKGVIEGTGTYMWISGKSYNGHWKKSKMEGFGNLKWPDGVEYIGQFSQDKFHGQGQYYWNDGKIYIGEWFQGLQHDERGKLIKGGTAKIGKYVMGERQGDWLQEIEESLSVSDIDSRRDLSYNPSRASMMSDLKSLNSKIQSKQQLPSNADKSSSKYTF